MVFYGATPTWSWIGTDAIHPFGTSEAPAPDKEAELLQGQKGAGTGKLHAKFARRLQGLGEGSKMKQRAEVAAYFGRFHEAEAIYRDMDRKVTRFLRR